MATRPASPQPVLDVFSDLRLRDSRHLKSVLAAPWGLGIHGYHPRAVFHFVAEGGCTLRVGRESSVLEEGDFVLLPHGDDHELVDDAKSSVERLDVLPKQLVSKLGSELHHGGEGPRSVLVSGAFVFEPHPVVAELPSSVLLRRTDTGLDRRSPKLCGIVETLVKEVAFAQPGSETVVNLLTDVLVIRAIRSWLDRAPEEHGGWFGALRHAGLGRALARIHTEPERAWTLENLAEEAGMSRSSFAKKFGEQVGVTPIQFLTHRRMQIATRWLREEALSISEVSDRLGYSSAAAFSRAFKRYTGSTPGVVARGAAARG